MKKSSRRTTAPLIRLPDCFGCRTTELRRSEVQEWDFKGNALDSTEGAQQNEGRHIQTNTGKHSAVRHAAGGEEQAHGLIA